ncbi:hypothetical protein V5799_000805 [Amblyomma americanum]|uniref:Uncharacterized protein n=1 Tax=Amblyomma americanum TaxID=6943 RepID=A0AAQ4D205_AMBAM
MLKMTKHVTSGDARLKTLHEHVADAVQRNSASHVRWNFDLAQSAKRSKLLFGGSNSELERDDDALGYCI